MIGYFTCFTLERTSQNPDNDQSSFKFTARISAAAPNSAQNFKSLSVRQEQLIRSQITNKRGRWLKQLRLSDHCAATVTDDNAMSLTMCSSAVGYIFPLFKGQSMRDKLVAEIKRLWAKNGGEVIQKHSEVSASWHAIVSGDREFWLWETYLRAMATTGGAAHDERVRVLRDLVIAKCGVDPLDWRSIKRASPEEQDGWLLLAANPNPVRQVQKFLKAFVSKFSDNDVRDLQRSLETMKRQVCIDLLKSLPGVGDKIARNMLMDIGHPEFMEGSFALDSRLATWLREITGHGHTYGTHATLWTEDELNTVAKDCALTSWQMDRLVFGYGVKELRERAAAERKQSRKRNIRHRRSSVDQRL